MSCPQLYMLYRHCSYFLSFLFWCFYIFILPWCFCILDTFYYLLVRHVDIKMFNQSIDVGLKKPDLGIIFAPKQEKTPVFGHFVTKLPRVSHQSCLHAHWGTSKQSGRSPKVVALFSATNFSSNIIELLQLHDTIQIKWNYAYIHYYIAIRSYLMK